MHPVHKSEDSEVFKACQKGRMKGGCEIGFLETRCDNPDIPPRVINLCLESSIDDAF